ncbi:MULTISPECIES: M20 aminoacylase family protein [unclassified Bradyrhizobium]|uniref:M20 aminoacylase family protein n=1 Tax=unclassified Bradyrhizobium TaxID=2631580 RepID=UPI001FF8E384|nr:MULTISPECIES: M20 aminoacylase family protein [unclassified Bradyrhizobium]MCK1348700.1 amidohydrolase [Bradyrhizobium sp. CW11]MCK1700412.1 amidohydrolase [Bradyrhizobium sp. 146]
MKVLPEIAAAKTELQALRRWFHANPELGFEETQTSDLIAKTLEDYGIEVHRGLGSTGVVGVLRAGDGRRSIGLRSDMDALPIQELNRFAHRSLYEGKMHACGHDGHMAMLLGAARHLARSRDFDGTIVFIFSPAEELGIGAKAMVDEGIFKRFPVDAVFGLHNWPGMPVNSFGFRPGPILAASAGFSIRVIGVGAHAAFPHNGKDPVLTGAQIVTALQGIITRSKKPIDTAVLSVTQFQGGDASNVIPESVRLAGTVRAFSEATLDLIVSRMATIVRNIAAAHECQAELEIRRSPATINTPEETRFAAEVMKSMVGEAKVDVDVEPMMGGEDFAYMLQARPGAFALLGAGNGEHREQGHGPGPCDVHNPSYDFNDEILGLGSTYWVRLSQSWLSGRIVTDRRYEG